MGKLKPKDSEPEPDEQVVELEQRGEVVNNIVRIDSLLVFVACGAGPAS